MIVSEDKIVVAVIGFAVVALAIVALLLLFDGFSGEVTWYEEQAAEVVWPKPFFSPPQVEPLKIPGRSVIYNDSVFVVGVRS